MQLRRSLKTEQPTNMTESIYYIQLKEVISNNLQKGLKFETLMLDGKEVTVVRGTCQRLEEFQSILKRLEEMNLHFQRVTVETLQSSPA